MVVGLVGKGRPRKATEEEKLSAVLETTSQENTCILNGASLKGRKDVIWDRISEKLGNSVSGSTLYFSFAKDKNLLQKYRIQKGNMNREPCIPKILYSANHLFIEK